MIAKTYLDDTAVVNPNGINELEQELFYDDELNGIFFRLNNDLEFHGSGFDYIWEQLLSTGYCSKIDFLLQIGNDALRNYFNGTIPLTNITDINVTRETLRTPVVDNNLSIYIYNNKNVKCYPNVNKSKNGETITPASAVTLGFFTPSTGNFDYSISQIYTVDECFNYLIAFLSDGQMTYSSPFFGVGGEKEGLSLVTGGALRGIGSTSTPFISFFDLFTEMDKLYRLSVIIDFTGTVPELIIDQTDNIYSDTDLMTFTEVRDLLLKIDKERIYANLNIGSTTTDNDPAFQFPVVKFLGFNQEEYHLGGQCNVDRSINLVNNYIIDSNVIEDVLLNSNDEYDDEIFIVETDGPGTLKATQFVNLIPGSYIYNLGLTNFYKAQNHVGAFPNDVILYINNDVNGFEAQDNSVVLATGVVILPTEISDPGGNHSIVTGRYTCPIAGDGTYTFTFDYGGLSYSGDVSGTLMAELRFKHYDSGGTLLTTGMIKDFTSEPVTPANNFGSYSWSFYLQATDYVVIEANVITGTVSFGLITFSGIFADEGGNYQAYNPNDYRVFALEFETILTQDQFEDIRDNVTDKITVQSGNKTFTGWVRSLKRNIYTGKSKIVLRTSNNEKGA